MLSRGAATRFAVLWADELTSRHADDSSAACHDVISRSECDVPAGNGEHEQRHQHDQHWALPLAHLCRPLVVAGASRFWCRSAKTNVEYSGDTLTF